MNQFLHIFGDKSIGWALAAICAVIFLYGIYKKVEKYFSDKAVREAEKEKALQEVIEQTKKYPEWHEQSMKIRAEWNRNICQLGDKLDTVEVSLSEIKKENAIQHANSCRYRILRFDDEIRHEEHHSKEHFDQILEDITEYENYCKEHSEYQNNKATLAIENIKRIYRKCNEESSFL